MPSSEKRKVGTILEVSLLKRLKIQAAHENRPMAEVIADAIRLYIKRAAAKPKPKVSSPEFGNLLKHPSLQASCSDVRAVLDEDVYQL